jgi:hypothetical protein
MRRERSLSTTDLVECSREVNPSQKLFAEKMSLQRERMVLRGSRDEVEMQVPYSNMHEVFISLERVYLVCQNLLLFPDAVTCRIFLRISVADQDL